jgi:hypothetical protein
MWTHPEHGPEPQVHQPPTRPLPLVNPPKVRPRPNQHQHRGQYPMFNKILGFLISASLFTLAFAAMRYMLGSITGSHNLDNFCYWAALAFYFFAYVLTDYGYRWAEKYCGFLKK